MVLHKRKPKLWKPFEDLTLTDLVRVYGERRWITIAGKLKKKFNISRTLKQCRERWYNYLSQINSQPLSKFEIKIIFEAQKKYKNKWSKIAKLLLGRTENQVKNFMHATIRRNIRKFNKDKPDEEKINISTLDLLYNQEIRSILTAEKEIKRSILMKTYLSSEAKGFIRSLTIPSNKIEDKQYQNSKIIINDIQDWDLKEFQDIADAADNFNNDRRTACLVDFFENKDYGDDFLILKSLKNTVSLNFLKL